MIKSYSDMYLEDTCSNLGSMMEYAVRIGFDPVNFWKSFTASELAEQIEKGNPRYLSGFSGYDYTNMVINMPSIKHRDTYKRMADIKGVLTFNKYFWAGYVLGELQQKTGISFFDIERKLPFETVLRMYSTLHEADFSKFYDLAIKKIESVSEETNLKKIRLASGLSQSRLAKASDVDIRSIQMYEQRKNDINKSQAATLYKLSKALGCNLESLLEKEII